MESQTTMIKARLIKSMMICLTLIVPVAGFDAGTAAQSQSSSTGPIVLRMKRVGGIYTVPCSINGLQLAMIVDTGAAVVSISQVEAAFMLKNGYLKPDDFRGPSTYTTADGRIIEGTRVTLRLIVLGDSQNRTQPFVELRNVEASVTSSAVAPLLLGQSALTILRKIEIDYVSETITIPNFGLYQAPVEQSDTVRDPEQPGYTVRIQCPPPYTYDNVTHRCAKSSTDSERSVPQVQKPVPYVTRLARRCEWTTTSDKPYANLRLYSLPDPKYHNHGDLGDGWVAKNSPITVLERNPEHPGEQPMAEGSLFYRVRAFTWQSYIPDSVKFPRKEDVRQKLGEQEGFIDVWCLEEW